MEIERDLTWLTSDLELLGAVADRAEWDRRRSSLERRIERLRSHLEREPQAAPNAPSHLQAIEQRLHEQTPPEPATAPRIRGEEALCAAIRRVPTDHRDREQRRIGILRAAMAIDATDRKQLVRRIRAARPDDPITLAISGRCTTESIEELIGVLDGRKSVRLPPEDARAALPDELATGVEQLSGFDMSDVRVHYNSAEPAQVGALAFAAGSDIHLGTGQEEHLPHEAWHVVQQKQGRVSPGRHLKGGINADADLEREADEMGARAATAPEDQQRGSLTTRTAAPTAIQRKITIKGVNQERAIGPTSGIIIDLFDKVVLPWLNKKVFKPYGIKTQLREFIRITDEKYGSTDAFMAAFVPWLEQRTRTNQRSNKTSAVLQKFDPNTMSRPKWPSDYQEKMGFRPSDNIRHVIRNATLKRALAIEYERWIRPDERKGRFAQFASVLGIQVENDDPTSVVPAIYRALYLNRQNLFAGDGAMNQAIGFAADPVTRFGEELVSMGEAPVLVGVVKKAVLDLVKTACEKVKTGQGTEMVYEQIAAVVSGLCDSLATPTAPSNDSGLTAPTPDSKAQVPAEEAGELVSNIGLNFGFDLIDGRVDEDQNNIGKRQGMLVNVETELQRYISSKGTSGDLLAICATFLGKPVPSGNSDKKGTDENVGSGSQSLFKKSKVEKDDNNNNNNNDDDMDVDK